MQQSSGSVPLSSTSSNLGKLFPSPRRRSGKLRLGGDHAESDGQDIKRGKVINEDGKEHETAPLSGPWASDPSDRPAFYFVTFMTTPPPVLPCGSKTYADFSAVGAGKLQHGPPHGSLVVVTDRYGEYRAAIDVEGTVVNNRSQVLGFINFAERSAGSASEALLGQAQDQLSGDEVDISDASGVSVGCVHLGSGLIRDTTGSTVAEVRRDGSIQSSLGSNLGALTPFMYGDLRSTASLFLLLIDPGMLSTREE